MKIILAPNSFKGSLSASSAAQAMAAGLRRSGLGAELVVLPLADGGDGTLEAFLAGGGERRSVATVDALGREIVADYGILADGQTAVIEMALVSGLARLSKDEITPENALGASTYGTGLMLRAALEAGCQRIMMGLGGSATSDGGMGCMSALGVRFLDGQDQALALGGGDLWRLARIELPDFAAEWRTIEMVIASDVTHVAIGEQGAARVFAPQKGASTPESVAQLERGLDRYFEVIHQTLGVDVGQEVGGGAAGALAAGLMAFFGARIESGADLVLDYHGFDEQMRDADLVVTGEGQLDAQTLGGKAPMRVAQRALRYDVPTVALVGGVRGDEARLYEAGLRLVMPIVTHPMLLDEAIANAGELMESAAMRLGYALLLGQGLA